MIRIRRASDGKVMQIRDVYKRGMTVAEIVKLTGCKYRSAEEFVKTRNLGYKSLGDYKRELCRRKGLTLTEYQKLLLKKRGHTTKSYQNDLARKKGYSSKTGYNRWLVINQRGFKSMYEYEKYLVKRRRENPTNQEIAYFFRQRLFELGKTQKWLAEELGITKMTVSRYMTAKNKPRKQVQEKLFKALKLSCKSLEDLEKILDATS